MPTISLRLSEPQHQQLVQWAANNKRSIQGELIWRLFPPDELFPDNAQRAYITSEPAKLTIRPDQPTDVGACKEFKGPDLKPTSHKKKR